MVRWKKIEPTATLASPLICQKNQEPVVQRVPKKRFVGRRQAAEMAIKDRVRRVGSRILRRVFRVSFSHPRETVGEERIC